MGHAGRMNEAEIIAITRETLWVMLKLAGPMMMIALIVGVAVSLVQALTQIQEATLTFIPKVALMMVAALMLLPFMMQTLGTFTEGIAQRIIDVGRNDDTATAP